VPTANFSTNSYVGFFDIGAKIFECSKLP
jgi:hypothetical protein